MMCLLVIIGALLAYVVFTAIIVIIVEGKYGVGLGLY